MCVAYYSQTRNDDDDVKHKAYTNTSYELHGRFHHESRTRHNRTIFMHYTHNRQNKK